MVSLFRPARQGWRRFINRLQQRITRTRGSFLRRTCRWPRGNILRRPVVDPKLIFKSVYGSTRRLATDPPNGRTDGHHCRVLVRPQVSSFVVQLVLRFVWFDSPPPPAPFRDFPPYYLLAEVLPQDHCRELSFLLSFSPPFFFLTKHRLSLADIRRPTLDERSNYYVCGRTIISLLRSM